MASDLANDDAVLEAVRERLAALAKPRRAVPPIEPFEPAPPTEPERPPAQCHEIVSPHKLREEYLASDIALANDNVPSRTTSEGTTATPLLQREQPHHREIVLLRMAGYTAREIAQHTGYGYSMVCTVLRQPWARQRLLKHLQASKQGLLDILAHEAAESVLTLVELRDTEDAPAAVRKAAADSLLDRYLGKAPQTVNLNKADVPTNVADAEQRLAALRAEENRLRGN